MTDLPPFQEHLACVNGEELPLPAELARLFHKVHFPRLAERPWVITNFVSTLDGVISLSEPGRSGGGDISGYNLHDQAYMGLLRAAADAVIVGAGQLRKPPGTLWLPSIIYPALADAYAGLRWRMHKTGEPLQVIVSAGGRLEPSLPIFQTPGLDVLILTTAQGEARLSSARMADQVKRVVCGQEGEFHPADILKEVNRLRPCSLVLIEGGPGLAGDFLAANLLDELFLTLAPQVAGRTQSPVRPGFVEGRKFAPFDARWSQLCGIRQADNHLFLRYRFTGSAG